MDLTKISSDMQCQIEKLMQKFANYASYDVKSKQSSKT